MKSAVLILDVQRGLLTRRPKPFESDILVSRINIVTEKARSAGIPIIFVQMEHPQILPMGSEAWELHPELVIDEADRKIRKSTADAFAGTPLHDQLKGLSIGSRF